MDNSETYIKMCQKAVKIQAMRELDTQVESGDWFVDKEHPEGVAVFLAGMFYGCPNIMTSYQAGWCCEDHIEHLGERTWLPLQDQLQKMMKGELWEILHRLNEFAFDSYSESFKHGGWLIDTVAVFTSMEQLWLAFVMKEKYGKTWSGEDWVDD